MKNKVISMLMALVLSLSMTSTTALAAFADQLQLASIDLQAAGEPIVYDSVYGVFGNYAVMEKSVQVEETLSNGNAATKTYKVTDVIDARDGQVTLHTSNAPDDDILPGEWTDYSSTITRAVSGFVTIQSKSTGKYGVKRFDGIDVIPCEYDNIAQSDNDDFACVAIDGSSATLDFIGSGGSELGSFDCTFENSESDDDRDPTSSVRFYGSYAGFWVSGSRSTVHEVFKKTSSGYVKIDGASSVISTGSQGDALLKDDDGYACYCDSKGALTQITPYDSYRDGGVSGSFVWLDDWTYVGGQQIHDYDVYNISGKHFDFGKLRSKSLNPSTNSDTMPAFAFMGNSIMVNDGDKYVLYDADGNAVRTIEDGYVDVPYRYDIGINANYYTVSVPDGSGYRLDAYALDGTLIRSFGTTDSQQQVLEKCQAPDWRGQNTYVGYEWKGLYYDFDLDPTTYEVLTENSLKLADGTLIWGDAYSGSVRTNASATSEYQWTSVSKNGYTLKMATDNGNKSIWQSVKRGNSDIWWATDRFNMWGAIDSYGNVKIPFMYTSYYDLGHDDTDYALVKKDNKWEFFNVATDALPSLGNTGSDETNTTGDPTDPTIPHSIESGEGAIINPDKNTGDTSAGNDGGGESATSGSPTAPAGSISPGGSAAVTYMATGGAAMTVVKTANTMKVKASAKSVKRSKLKKSARVSAIAVTDAQGVVSYKNANTAKKLKKFKVSASTGKITVPKGTKKGAYKVKVRVTAAGDATHEPATKVVTCKIKVK